MKCWGGILHNIRDVYPTQPTRRGLRRGCYNAEEPSKCHGQIRGSHCDTTCSPSAQHIRQGWYLAEIDKIYPDEIEATYYATPRPSLDNYETSSKEQRMEALGEACFRRTWYIRQGKNAGMATNKAPKSGVATLERKTTAHGARRPDTSHWDHSRSQRAAIKRLANTSEPTRH